MLLRWVHICLRKNSEVWFPNTLFW